MDIEKIVQILIIIVIFENMRKNFDNIIAFTLSTIGSLFLVYYIFRGSTDVVSSDYIRIINYYIDDVTDLKYLLSWESISRIPFTFLARFINVKCFHYSVFFDRILGILGLFIFNFTLIKYIFKKYVLDIIKVTLSIIVTLISFSLMSWEMILNGTGYPHFITVGLIAITFYNFESNMNSSGSCRHPDHHSSESTKRGPKSPVSVLRGHYGYCKNRQI